ncbi:peroxiredoxin-like family protein [uncultured Zobellia sp.]|uniref:peroxiredoxin-like family protein n=1 Tax=uncultured Zobellia sp. TaxID=255433 RepID=UPI00259510BD|nr:peroxiredoxin-like family protein [uncultured Zobellia sp.]
MTLLEQTEKVRQNVMNRMPQPIIENFKNDIQQLRENKLREKALQIGDHIPNALLTDITGNDFQLASLLSTDYLILNFYRGGWCPYCNMELREYERLKTEFQSYGANILAISAEVPQLAAQTHAKNEITFPLATDKNAVFMKEVGIVFSISEKAQKDFVGFGMDFKNIHGNENFELPVPAIYVIDKNLKIAFVHIEEDYMTRLEPKELLKKLKNNEI